MRTLALDPIRRVGRARVGVIAARHVTCRRVLGTVQGHCAKEPLLILVHADGATRAFRISGREVPADEVERLCPGAMARMAAP